MQGQGWSWPSCLGNFQIPTKGEHIMGMIKHGILYGHPDGLTDYSLKEGSEKPQTSTIFLQ